MKGRPKRGGRRSRRVTPDFDAFRGCEANESLILKDSLRGTEMFGTSEAAQRT